jgi:hypothetical protein
VSTAVPPVEVAFVVETGLYDGVYSPGTSFDSGYDPCAGADPANAPACEESNGVPFFVANAQSITDTIQQAHPESAVTFAMVDYFATNDSDDDHDGLSYHVDIPRFVPPDLFGHDVVSTFQAKQLQGGWTMNDSDFSDNILDSSVITALYGTIDGSGLNWSLAARHIIVWMGDMAPRDPSYIQDYTVSPSDHDVGTSSGCEPAYDFGGFLSPRCEGWVRAQDGNASDSIAQLARTAPNCAHAIGGECTIDMIDLYSTPTDPYSRGWPCNATLREVGGCPGGSEVLNDTERVLQAGCDLANATGGTWDGPNYFGCPNGHEGQLQPVFVGSSTTQPNLQNPSLLQSFGSVGFGQALAVTFNESGLPDGSGWWVNVSGGPSTFSNTSTLSFMEHDGTYNYSTASSDKTYSSPGGSFTVAGSPALVPLTFSRRDYNVTVAETGLPTGTAWSTALGGRLLASTLPTILFAVPNGTYPYIVGKLSGWTTSNYTGTITVDGAAASTIVIWTQLTYTVTFRESGLPPDTNWSVQFGNSPIIALARTQYGLGEIVVRGLANGTFYFWSGSVQGYGVAPKLGSITIAGASVVQTIAFVAAATTFLGLPAFEGYTLLGAGAVAVALLVMTTIVVRRRRSRGMPPGGSVQPLSSPGKGRPPRTP